MVTMRASALHMVSSSRFLGFAICMAAGLLSAACTFPGPVAPSTMPLTGKYVELGRPEVVSSCGFSLLGIRFKNPQSVYDAIQEMIKSRGGDALINVDSNSYSYWYFIASSDCFEIRGTVVKISQ
jgi:hypothetical protein